MRILLVSDSSDSARIVVEQLVQLGSKYKVDVVPWSLFTSRMANNTDLVLVNDYKSNDCEKLVRLRQSTDLPILLISALQDDETIVHLYASGIDDHLVQPISYPILSAKLRVWERWASCSIPKLLCS